MPTNLLAHHLNVLESVGLVRRSRSESDRRRHYVRLDPAAFEAIEVRHRQPRPTGRVLFVCTANSARSQLAAALWSAQVGPAASAGLCPARAVHPGAIDAARRHGLRLLADKPAHLTQVWADSDFIITVCDAADRELVERHLHWSVPDPVRLGTDAAFEEAYQTLAMRIDALAHTG